MRVQYKIKKREQEQERLVYRDEGGLSTETDTVPALKVIPDYVEGH